MTPHTQQHTNGNKIMENLKIQNDNGSTYSFYVDNFKIYIDARTPKGVLHTFRVNARLNGAPLWKLVVRETGEEVITNYRFDSAFNDACSGYIESWDGTRFEGVNQEYHRG